MAQNGNSNNVQPPQVQDQFPEGRYPCMFCPKKFSNSQALGGHQNAHKLERAILSQQGQKMFRRDMNIPGHGGYPVGTHHYYPYPMPAPSMVASPPVPYYSVPPHQHYVGVAQGPGYHGIVPRGMMMGQQLPPAAANSVFMPGSSSQLVPTPPAGPGFYPNPIPSQQEGSSDSKDSDESKVDLTLKL